MQRHAGAAQVIHPQGVVGSDTPVCQAGLSQLATAAMLEGVLESSVCLLKGGRAVAKSCVALCIQVLLMLP